MKKRIAILGATSEIARDFIALLFDRAEIDLLLYARQPNVVHDWLLAMGRAGAATVRAFNDFPPGHGVDALINFVGVGNPAQARLLGVSIFELTQACDIKAIDFVRKYPDCRYIFLSSGAVYGNSFEQPVTEQSPAQIRINHLQNEDWYAVAKLQAECRHRALPDIGIVDLRVFSYFSHTQKMDANFLMADVVSAIGANNILKTSNVNIVRDYLHPSDFYKLVFCVLDAPIVNTSLDCYSCAPIDKFALLEAMQSRFGLRYVIDDSMSTGDHKLKYYSLNHLAEVFGYQPSLSSLNGILQESEKLFNRHVK